MFIVTIGDAGRKFTHQSQFPGSVNCVHCKGKQTARIAFTAFEDFDGLAKKGEIKYVTNLSEQYSKENPQGIYWVHDLCAVAVYFCTVCLEATALVNQG